MKPLRRLLRHLKRELQYYETEQDNLLAMLELNLTKEERGDASRRYLTLHGKIISTIETIETVTDMLRRAKSTVQQPSWYPWIDDPEIESEQN
jgi:hypothetical protein